jgi:hypothetical protein
MQKSYLKDVLKVKLLATLSVTVVSYEVEFNSLSNLEQLFSFFFPHHYYKILLDLLHHNP